MKRWLLLLIAAVSAQAGEIPVLSESLHPFRFIVLGDVHYSRPQFEARNIIATIAESVKDSQPPVAFVCQTGDIVEGGTYAMQEGKRVFRQASHEEMREELAFALNDVTARFRRPLFIAIGNHDKHAGGRAVTEIVWPMLSHQLGVPVTKNCYGFRYGNSVFAFLDFAPSDYNAQQKWVLNFLEQARAAGCRHVFLFGHYPLWTLVRPGFHSQRFTDSVLPVFRRFPVDVFFCGHTHNTAAWVRRWDGATITQLKGVTCQSSSNLIPMEERRTVLLPRTELSYYWGYLSGLPAAFFLVTVDGERVQVQFRSAATVVREFEWRQPGQITDLKKPVSATPPRMTEAMLGQAASATLVVCPWAEERTEIGVALNGERVALAQVGPTMRSSAFANEKRIPIPAAKVQLVNDVTFENPKRAIFGLGHGYLEVKLKNGQVAHSAVSDRFHFSATEAEGHAAGLTYGWKIVPPQMVQTVSLGQALGPMRLRF